MKGIFTALFVISALYLSSCNDKDTDLYALPKQDTVSNAGYVNITMFDTTYHFVQMTVNKSPVHSLIALTQSFDQQDTLWIGQIQVTDHKQKIVSMNLNVYKASDPDNTGVGTYYVRSNNSTLTDFTEGKNRVYGVTIGSSVDITTTGYTTRGTFSLGLHYNNQYYPATGNFEIHRF